MSSLPARADVVVVGGGIVGLATACRVLEKRPGTSLVLLEKEPEPASHQTGHNSGVIHSGIYYPPGSLKARLCREGRESLLRLCEEEGIAHRRCGKVIVAVDDSEVPALLALAERGLENGVDCEVVDPERLAELEPEVAGVRAIHVRDAGVVDFGEVAGRLARRAADAGATLVTSAPVVGLTTDGSRTVVETPGGAVSAGHLVACAGLHADRVATMSSEPLDVAIIPFRGEYYRLRESAARRVRTLVYPVPDPRFPFLGVHLTRTIHDEVKAGPNAVLALRREGYRRGEVSVRELAAVLAFPGFRRMARRHFRMGLSEMWRSWSRAAFARAVARLLPDITPDDLAPGPTGVRAQALRRDGTLLDDFEIRRVGTAMHVLNAPSPAATAALAIGGYLAERLD